MRKDKVISCSMPYNFQIYKANRLITSASASQNKHIDFKLDCFHKNEPFRVFFF